ncbi:MAG: AAA family ATPase [Sphingomonas sp.]
MRLQRIWIDGYRNLNNVEAVFDDTHLTTVIIGQNGTGKSNLLQCIAEIFRNLDLGESPPLFKFEMTYRIEKPRNIVSLTNSNGPWAISVNGEPVSRREFQERKLDLMPDTIFGYDSGTNTGLSTLFDTHQEQYYRKLIADNSTSEFKSVDIVDRRLFYTRSVHGVLALLALLKSEDPKVKGLLKKMIGITGIHSAMLVLRRPWFGKGKGRDAAWRLWGAGGRPGRAARLLRDHAFFPMYTPDIRTKDDYRSGGKSEDRLALYLRNEEQFQAFAGLFQGELALFEELESIDISDLYRWVQVWVTRDRDIPGLEGDVSYGEMSEGERQVIAVLGLIWLMRRRRVLFLLDEPDTHLNPEWQLNYLELIRSWTETAESEENCQIILTSHNPLTIAALTRKEVRVMQSDAKGQVKVSEPYADPRGLGFTSTLTEIFGLPTTLDPETQKKIDERNQLARIEERSEKQERMLIELNDKLDRLGFMHESRDPLYDDFLKAVQDVKYADRPPMTQDQIERRRLAMQALIKSLTEERGKTH